ncbi:hypothetical protein HHK36_020851 [Tetracentron sinense]|uniref:Uncharacterized protein n=1 Tax=Tetracentron sinense TaxID=13715 RepID=A0A835DBF3_TETSI|nr:hypothetical protein HHK36_020851 [Tetracentron sinense]
MGSLEAKVMEMLASLQGQVEEMRGEFAIWKRAMANGGLATHETPKEAVINLSSYNSLHHRQQPPAGHYKGENAEIPIPRPCPSGQMMQNSTTTTTTTTIGEGQLRFEFFSDGWTVDELKGYDLDALMKQIDLDSLMHQIETVGKTSFTRLINKQAQEGRPVSCIINNTFTPWALNIAAELGILTAVLWIQSCAVFSTYYHYFHGLASFPTITQPDLPFKNLSKAFCVLVDSFEELEHEIIESMSHFSPVKPIGPLFKSPHGTNTSVPGDMWRASDDCLQWLDSKPLASVVYISFGSNAILKKDQMEEIV